VAVTAAAPPARAQLAPTGGHYAARASDTGFSALVNSSGAFSQTVPLDLPQAKGALPVPVQIVYGGRAVGAAGMGWDVPLSYVLRDTSFDHRLPTLDANSVPVGTQRLTLVLNGRAMLLMRKGDQQTSTIWVPIHDGPQIEVHEDAQNGAMLVYDGEGNTYTFVNNGPVGPPGQNPTDNVPLLGGNLYLLRTIRNPSNQLQLDYVNTTFPVVGGRTGLEVDLHSISYNLDSTGTCYKNRVLSVPVAT
jgi:hypothetical protein